ncbi:MAG: DUF2306 domain-containing protein [Flavobacteriaceae bacterium]
MEIERIAEILIYFIHAPLGGIALLAGGISLIAKKGNNVHKKSGRVFFFSMLFSAISAFIISVLPNHESPFLFSIGLFSTYFLISGLRSLKFKQKEFQLKTEKIIAYLITLTGIVMILYPVLLFSKLNIILTVFGVVGIVFGLRDLKLFKDIKRLKKNWLKLHLGKMTGGYIAATSAFFVVNQILPGIWNWFVPGIIGSGYITYWMIKLNKNNL